MGLSPWHPEELDMTEVTEHRVKHRLFSREACLECTHKRQRSTAILQRRQKTFLRLKSNHRLDKTNREAPWYEELFNKQEPEQQWNPITGSHWV